MFVFKSLERSENSYIGFVDFFLVLYLSIPRFHIATPTTSTFDHKISKKTRKYESMRKKKKPKNWNQDKYFLSQSKPSFFFIWWHVYQTGIEC